MSDLSKIYEKHVTPGLDSFITRFDAGLKLFLRNIFIESGPKSTQTIESFLTEDKMLTDPLYDKNKPLSVQKYTDEATAEKIIDACLDIEDETPIEELKEILNLTLKQFLAEALLYDARILSNLERNERKSLTKPEINDEGKIYFWNPAEKTALITKEYLDKISSFSKGKILDEKDYNTKKKTPVIGPFGITIPDKEGLSQVNRVKYGFGVDYKDEDKTKTVFRDGTILRTNFCRRLGVIIYDLIMAKIGKKVVESLELAEQNNIKKLFAEFIDSRSNKIAYQINSFLGIKPEDSIKIVLLQEVGKAISEKLPKSTTTTKSQIKKITENNAGSMILSSDKSNNFGKGEDCDEKKTGKEDCAKYELEHSNLTVKYSPKGFQSVPTVTMASNNTKKNKNDIILQLFSFHGDTNGLQTKKAVEKILTDPKYKDAPLIIGLDSNLKTPDLLFGFMEMCKKKGAKIAGFNLESLPDLLDKKFSTFYDELKKFATNGGIRSGCQSQWGKMHSKTNDYIDFIVYRAGAGSENNLKQVSVIDGKSTSITPLSITAEAIKETALVNAGVVDNKVDGWGAKVLSETNPSDHLPRCSTFQLGETTKFSVLSWNVAGPNFNWAEYYGSNDKNKISSEINKIQVDEGTGASIAARKALLGIGSKGGRRRTKKQQSRKKRKRQGKRSKKQKRTKTRRN